jgi:hypothetical protein
VTKGRPTLTTVTADGEVAELFAPDDGAGLLGDGDGNDDDEVDGVGRLAVDLPSCRTDQLISPAATKPRASSAYHQRHGGRPGRPGAPTRGGGPASSHSISDPASLIDPS